MNEKGKDGAWNGKGCVPETKSFGCLKWKGCKVWKLKVGILN